MESNHKDIMQKASLFHGISDKEYTALINCLSPQVRTFLKNETIFFTGDPVRHIGIILCGTAHAYLEHINGNQTIMSTLAPMSVFGEILVSTRTQQSPVTVSAASGVTAAFIDFQKVSSMCKTACVSHMTFLQNMLKAIGDKYFYLFDRINILRERTLRSRIMSYLYSLSEHGEASAVTLPFSKTLLAEYLLINRSSLSKELHKMEQDGIINFNGREIELKFLNMKESFE